MSHDLHVQFLLEQPPTDVLTPSRPDELSDSPPPWEPQFEELSPHLYPSPPSRRPLDPPPSCFSTLTPLRIRSRSFPPFCIPAVSDKLTDGFRMLYPLATLERHGISRSDWTRFLEDLVIAARLSRQGLGAVGSRVPITPLIAHRVFPSHCVGVVYDGYFARNTVEEVRALIELWNQCALERRKVRVSLQMRPAGTSGKKRYLLMVESL